MEDLGEDEKKTIRHETENRRMTRCWNIAKAWTSQANRPLDLRVEKVKMRVKGGHILLVRPKSEEQVLDLYVERGNLEGDPYWACPWPSAAALAERMALANEKQEKWWGNNANVADLGAGLGLAGLAAAREGASQVTLLDREPMALHCAMIAADLNGLSTRRETEGMRWREDFNYRMEWTNEEKAREEGPVPSGGVVSAKVFDWSDPIPEELLSAFDTVLACDVLYDKDAASYVGAIVPRLLKEGGLLVLADPPMRTPKHRQECVRLLHDNARKDGVCFNLEQVCHHGVLFDEREVQVQIMHFRKSLHSTVGVKLT